MRRDVNGGGKRTKHTDLCKRTATVILIIIIIIHFKIVLQKFLLYTSTINPKTLRTIMSLTTLLNSKVNGKLTLTG